MSIRTIRAVLIDDAGGAMVEYAIFAASFSALMIAALLGLQNRTGTQFNSTSTGLTTFNVSPP